MPDDAKEVVTMTTAHLIRALIDCHLSAAKILQTLAKDLERADFEAQRREAETTKRAAPHRSNGVSSGQSRNEGLELYTTREAIELLKIGRSTLYALVARKTLPVVKIGKATRIRRSDLDRLMNEGA